MELIYLYGVYIFFKTLKGQSANQFLDFVLKTFLLFSLQSIWNSLTVTNFFQDFNKIHKLSRLWKWVLSFPKFSQTFKDRTNPVWNKEETL